jgi:hypothetical protein
MRTAAIAGALIAALGALTTAVVQLYADEDDAPAVVIPMEHRPGPGWLHRTEK